MDEIRPQPRQEIFLSSPADIAIFGGSAGGGKTYALLMEPLRHINNPKFGGVIFRRSIPEVTREGGLWDEANGLYPLLLGIPNENGKFFKFPGGSKISFAHLSDDKDLMGWRGSQIPLIEFDQLETFTEQQFFYMLSRNRSACNVRPYIRATVNPEPGWLADFVDWWIADDGYANLARSGLLRWFVRINDEIIWGTRDELTNKYKDITPKSVTFIPSTIYDNQILLKQNPEYLSNLQALSLVDRERLLGDPKRGGNWKIKPSAGKVFNRSWFEIVPAAPAGGGVACRRWDFAGSNKEIKGSDPDHTAGVLMLKHNGVYYILDVYDEQISAGAVDRVVKNTCTQDAHLARSQGFRYMTRWEEEPGSASKRDTVRMVQMLAGIDAGGLPARGDKLTHWKPLAAQAEAGNVKLVQGPWNERFLRAVHGVPDLPHDDIPDGASGAFENVNGGGGWSKPMKGK